jgi:hypothetical protein
VDEDIRRGPDQMLEVLMVFCVVSHSQTVLVFGSTLWQVVVA